VGKDVFHGGDFKAVSAGVEGSGRADGARFERLACRFRENYSATPGDNDVVLGKSSVQARVIPARHNLTGLLLLKYFAQFRLRCLRYSAQHTAEGHGVRRHNGDVILPGE